VKKLVAVDRSGVLAQVVGPPSNDEAIKCIRKAVKEELVLHFQHDPSFDNFKKIELFCGAAIEEAELDQMYQAMTDSKKHWKDLGRVLTASIDIPRVRAFIDELHNHHDFTFEHSMVFRKMCLLILRGQSAESSEFVFGAAKKMALLKGRQIVNDVHIRAQMCGVFRGLPQELKHNETEEMNEWLDTVARTASGLPCPPDVIDLWDDFIYWMRLALVVTDPPSLCPAIAERKYLRKPSSVLCGVDAFPMKDGNTEFAILLEELSGCIKQACSLSFLQLLPHIQDVLDDWMSYCYSELCKFILFSSSATGEKFRRRIYQSCWQESSLRLTLRGYLSD